MKKKVQKIEIKIEHGLKRLCNSLSPAQRMIVVLAVSAAFAIVSLYFVVSSVLVIGTGGTNRTIDKKELFKIENIEGLKMPDNDSIKLLKQKK